MSLPNTKNTIETLEAKADAHDMVDHLIERNQTLEEVFHLLQPVLYRLSVNVYGENSEPVPLSQLIEDSIKWIDQHSNNCQDSAKSSEN
jgi:hypothetical protein